MYKVAIHPPGTTFPPNGLPVVTLFYRNDDGGPGYGKDSRLVFDPPADGEYQVRVGDARGQGGAGYAYRLTVRPPRPDFTVSFSPTAPAVGKGGAMPVARHRRPRIDGFDGADRREAARTCRRASTRRRRTSRPADNSTAFALFADRQGRPCPAKQPPLKLEARATIDGKEVVRTATGGVPKLVDAGRHRDDDGAERGDDQARRRGEGDGDDRAAQRLQAAACRSRCRGCRTASACWTSA